MSTLNKYEQLESDLVALFAGNSFDIVPLPDNENEYRPQLPRAQVYVAYESSDFSEPDTLSRVVQDEKIKFSFEIHSKTRRGEKGTLSIFEIIRKKIVGLKILGYDKMALIQAVSLAGSGAGHWVFYAQFSSNTKVSDCQPSPDSEGNLLKNAEFTNS